MSMQSDDLAMAGLGMIDDQPQTPLAAKLGDGVHLRWAFRFQRGFPWFGYYLFRREHRRGEPVCLFERDFEDLLKVPAKAVATPLGALRSDTELRVESAAGHAGADLSQGSYVRLRLAPAARAYAVEVSVAFRNGAKVRCRALAPEGVVVAEAELEGAQGDTGTVELRADRVAVVEIGPAPAVLFQLCVYPVGGAVQGGWKDLPKFSYPMCLPVAHPDYPCPSKPADPNAAEALGLGRISYGDPEVWKDEFPSVHRTLEALVAGGPSQPMYLRQEQVPVVDPPDGAPEHQVQQPLAMALLPTVHPAFAQLIGLYFLDTTAEDLVSYDYLILADHTGVLGGSAGKALDWLAGTPDFAAVDGWICFDLVRKKSDPLAPPADPRAYSLPDASGAADVRTVAGLTWDVGRGADGALVAGSPVMYHLWRVGFGVDEPGQPAPETKYVPLTEEAPVLVTMPGGPPGAEPSRPSPWPPFRIQTVDRRLEEGWYNHRVSGIDLFGRHSVLSEPARWYQWEPEPQPAPWYYQQPPGTRAVHDFAIRILDKTPPPPPAGVAATPLDPLDPMVVSDDVYDEWRAGLSDAERDTLVGIRVRWRWPLAHQAQAPRTREFRIYLDLGADLPAGYPAPHAWQVRRYVVGRDEFVRATADALEYELVLPRATDPDRTGFEAVPSLADPVRYGHLAVTAADDRDHTADDPKWSGTPFGDRPGNESVIAAPATLFRVLRTPPPPPAPVPAPAPKVFASRADYHGVSYYTFRFRPTANLTEHVYRAVAESVFDVDWASRPQPPLDTHDAGLFPDAAEDPRWGQPLRDAVAAELDALNEAADRAGAAEIYRGLSDDALRILAGLPGNHAAFTQRTQEPLDPDDLRYRDRRGPDTPDDYVPRVDRRAYVDVLDGVTTSRYLYRSAAVDGAYNRSTLAIAGPPVYLPDVMPPAPPRELVARGGDRAIGLRWRSSLEDDLAEYRVYRQAPGAAEPELVATLGETRPPADRPARVDWTDADVEPLTTFSYRVVAVDATGNRSAATRPIASRAFDDARPDPPVWGPAAIDPSTNTATLTWSSPDPALRPLVQRYADAIGWEALSPWLPRGDTGFVDDLREPGLTYRYRLRVLDAKGRTNRAHNELLA